MKPGWKVRPLGEVVEICSGGTPSKSREDFWKGDIPWVSPKDMKSAVITDSEDHISATAVANSATRLIGTGSLLLVVRSGILARTIPVGIAGRDVTINQDIKALIPSSSLDSHFLAYYLKAKEPALLGRVTRGATVHKLDTPVIKALPIPLPPLEEQKRIVAVLDEAFEGLDRARANAEANLADSREFAGIVASNALRMPARLATVGELVADGILFPPVDGNHGEIHPKKADFVPSGIPFIMASDLVNGEVDQSGCYFISEKQAKTLRKGFAKDGDVLVSHKGTIGRVALLKTAHDYAMLTPQVTYYRVRDQQRLDKTYLYYALKSREFQDQLLDGAKDGATRAYIGITKQLSLKIALPEIEDQRRIVSIAVEMEKYAASLVSNYHEKITELAAVRQSLLQRAFSGELT